MSITKKGRLVDVNAISTKPSSTVSTPNVLIETDNNGKIDTNLLKINEIIPPGTVVAYAGATAPSGWLLCNGAAISRTLYANLFTAIGTAHGVGDNSTTFNLPDYRGRFLRMVDGTAGRDPDKTSRTAMGTGGNTGNNVGSVQADAIRNITGGLNNVGAYPGASGAFTSSITGGTHHDGGTAVRISYNFNAANVVPTGGDNRPVNAYVNYIIKT